MEETLSQRLKALATHTLGFDLVGITTAEPLVGGDSLARWVAAGHHGEMGYMADTAGTRADPRRFLTGAKSVVCVAMSYHDEPEDAELTPHDDHVVVARYARHSDYHKVIKKRLIRLGRHLESLVPGARWRAACDTAPVLEKALSQRAGLGWIGKNTCLINRHLGSELLLGELVSDVELDPDDCEENHCGRCTACLDACPTQALPQPGLLDARQCIAYLTIEHRSEVPDALQSAVGAHLFGCDICQAVCPWNRRAPLRTGRSLRPRRELNELTSTELATYGAEKWRRLTAGTPLRRLDERRFRRNLRVVQRNAPTTATSGH